VADWLTWHLGRLPAVLLAAALGKPLTVPCVSPSPEPVFAGLQVFNEMNSPFTEDSSRRPAKKLANLSETDVAESNLKTASTATPTGSLPGLNMTVGDR